MVKVRVHEIAKELGIKSKEVVEKALEIGLDIKSASSVVSVEDAEKLMNYVLTAESPLAEIEKQISNKTSDRISLTEKNIENIEIEILKLKSIKKFSWKIQYKKGLHVIIGENGSGKSALIVSLAKLVQPSVLKQEFIGKGFEESQITYRINSNQFIFKKTPNWQLSSKIDYIEGLPKIKGFFESTILNGTRFKKIDYFLKDNIEIESSDTVKKADPFIITNMNYILTGDEEGRFDNLKEIVATRKRKKITSDEYLNKTYRYYGIKENESLFIKEFFLSTGEYFLLSLLKFLSFTAKNIEDTPSLIIIDEIELSLHPLAQKRLIERLQGFVEQLNLLVFIATHSLQIVDNVKPTNIYYLEKDLHENYFSTPIYPAYLHSKLYRHSNFDKVILVEDDLAESILKILIGELTLDKMKYIIFPIGGWEKVLEMLQLHLKNQIYGCASVVAILDGDIRDKACTPRYSNLKKQFLPIKNVESIVVQYLIERDRSFLSFIESLLTGLLYEDLDISPNDTSTDKIKGTYKKLIEEISKKSSYHQALVKHKFNEYIIRHHDFEGLLTYLKEFFECQDLALVE